MECNDDNGKAYHEKEMKQGRFFREPTIYRFQRFPVSGSTFQHAPTPSDTSLKPVSIPPLFNKYLRLYRISGGIFCHVNLATKVTSRSIVSSAILPSSSETESERNPTN